MSIYMRRPIPVKGISLNKTSIRLNNPGDTFQLVATIEPSNAEDTQVIWTTDDSTVATVSQTGLVTCVTPGTAMITATTHDGGYTATCGILAGGVPTGYQEVEYIENDSTCYIDTGLNNGIGYKIDFKIYTTSSNPSDQTFLGGSGTSNTNPIYAGVNYSNGAFFFAANGGWTNFLRGGGTSVNTTYEMSITLRNGTQEIISNGVSVYSATLSMSGGGTTHLTMFRRSSGSGNFKARLYYAQIYDNSDILVRDFIPCYRTNDTVIGLYDTVNGVFYTSGSGTFLKGPDV